MKSGSNKRTLFLLLLLGVLLAVAYPMLMPATTPTDTQNQMNLSDEVVATLEKLQAVDFNFSVLNNSAFAYLKDITTPPLNLSVGRPDPFAPTR